MKLEEFIPNEIYQTPDAILETINQTRQEAVEIADRMHKRSPRRIYVIGNGTSYYSSMAVSYTARSLAGADEPLVLPMPAGDFRYFTPALSSSDIIIGMSASGEFRDVLAVFEKFRLTNLCIGVTQVPGSSITRLAGAFLMAGGGPSQVPVMTKTYASTLTAAHALMLAFYKSSEAYWQDLKACANRCQAGIQEAEKWLPEILPHIQHLNHAYHFGAGCAYAAALETALKMKEMAMLHAEGAETWEMASGPAVIVGPHSLCVALYSGASSDTNTVQGAQHAREWRAPLIEFGPLSGFQHEAEDTFVNLGPWRWHIAVESPAYDCFASLVLVPAAALLAYRLARIRGFDPNRPEWRSRYHSQGLTHII